MTNVSFYKCQGDLTVALALVCQLVQKAVNAKQTVLCLVPDSDTAEQLDKLLWSFQASAFIPHGIGSQHHGILINLQAAIPNWFSRFDRVMEVIYSEPEYAQVKRENFAFYKERGYPLNFHDLSNTFKP